MEGKVVFDGCRFFIVGPSTGSPISHCWPPWSNSAYSGSRGLQSTYGNCVEKEDCLHSSCVKQLDALFQAFGCESMLHTWTGCVFMGEHSPATPPSPMVMDLCSTSLPPFHGGGGGGGIVLTTWPYHWGKRRRCNGEHLAISRWRNMRFPTPTKPRSCFRGSDSDVFCTTATV